MSAAGRALTGSCCTNGPRRETALKMLWWSSPPTAGAVGGYPRCREPPGSAADRQMLAVGRPTAKSGPRWAAVAHGAPPTFSHQIEDGETEVAFFRSMSSTNSFHAGLPTRREQYAPAIAANVCRNANMSSTKPANCVGTDVP